MSEHDETDPCALAAPSLAYMSSITVALGVVLEPGKVRCRGPQGWVARVTGTHPKYELARTFMERERDEAWVTHSLAGNGLYENRGLGEHEASGFFIVEGKLRRRVRTVPKETALAMVAR
jgi:hypothetical protein